jgi:hypothetical protein
MHRYSFSYSCTVAACAADRLQLPAVHRPGLLVAVGVGCLLMPVLSKTRGCMRSGQGHQAVSCSDYADLMLLAQLVLDTLVDCVQSHCVVIVISGQELTWRQLVLVHAASLVDCSHLRHVVVNRRFQTASTCLRQYSTSTSHVEAMHVLLAQGTVTSTSQML